jgi:hypothetical protein
MAPAPIDIGFAHASTGGTGIFTLSFALLGFALRTAAPAPVGPSALWEPPAGFLAAFHRECDPRTGSAFGDCFVEEMQKAGASPAAADFSRRIDSPGYLAAFRDAGRVDVGWAVAPLRANENGICFLLNGEPPLIDVDEPSRIRAALGASPSWTATERAHPDATVFPGDRFHTSAIAAEIPPGGGQRFLVPYLVRDGCHACAVVGRFVLAFDFDARGRFVATSVVSVEGERP